MLVADTESIRRVGPTKTLQCMAGKKPVDRVDALLMQALVVSRPAGVCRHRWPTRRDNETLLRDTACLRCSCDCLPRQAGCRRTNWPSSSASSACRGCWPAGWWRSLMIASASSLVTPAALSGAGRLAIDGWLQSLVAAGEDERGSDGALLDGVPVVGDCSVSARGWASVAAMPS